jgi:hypothetical protein
MATIYAVSGCSGQDDWFPLCFIPSYSHWAPEMVPLRDTEAAANVDLARYKKWAGTSIGKAVKAYERDEIIALRHAMSPAQMAKAKAKAEEEAEAMIRLWTIPSDS